MAKPILIITPVLRRLLELRLNLELVLNFLSTSTSQKNIIRIPKTIPKKEIDKLLKEKASGSKSKHTIAIISPEAKAKIKLKNLLEGFLNLTPIIPPIVVPKVPKNKPINVVFKISLKKYTPL